MTNYAIRQIRPLVQKQHIEQQREYFEKWAQGKSLKSSTKLTHLDWFHFRRLQL